MGFVEVAAVLNFVTNVTPSQKLVLIALADRAQPKPGLGGKAACWPSIDELVHRSNQSQRSVYRVISDLCDKGIIKKEKRWRRDDNGQSRQTSNRYIIDMPAIHAGLFLKQEDAQKNQPVENSESMGDNMTPIPVENSENMGDNMAPISQNPSSAFECQSGTQTMYGCQISGDMTATSGTLNIKKYKLNPPTPNNAPLLESDDAVSEGAAGGGESPWGSSPGEEEFSHQPAAHDLVAEAIPQPMQPKDASQREVINEMLAERIQAGWTTGQIYQVLNNRALPEQVHNMFGLVKARLRDDVPVMSHLDEDSPSKDSQQNEFASTLVDSNGRELRDYQIDWSFVARDHNAAKAAGNPLGLLPRKAFAMAMGIDRYVP